MGVSGFIYFTLVNVLILQKDDSHVGKNAPVADHTGQNYFEKRRQPDDDSCHYQFEGTKANYEPRGS